MALNHWKLAIETHNSNHPDTLHDCTDIQACNPRRYPSTDILITSPECTNHTLAKGKKRLHQANHKLFEELDAAEERSRATMWDVPRFAEFHNYNIIIVENVVEARTWRLWEAWLKAMHDLGYRHRCLYLNSMFFHPCPQSRDRMYVVFWKAGNREPELEHRPLGHCNHCGTRHELYQSWKNPARKFGKFKAQYIYRCSNCNRETMPFYFAAFNCIDWSIPGERIGDRKKPLAPNTIKRIEYGLKKYAGQSIVVTTRYSSGIDCRVRLSSEHLPTQPGDACHGIASPFIFTHEHSSSSPSGRVKQIFDSYLTQTSSQSSALVVPFIINLKKTSPARTFLEQMATVTASGNHHMLISNYSPGYAKTLEQPTGAITTQDHHGLFRIPIIVENKGLSNAKDSTAPLATITTHDYLGLLSEEKVNAFLMQYYNGSHVVSKAHDAIRTVTTGDRSGLFVPTETRLEDCYYRMLKPHEIQAAMAFADDYIVLGNSRDKVKQLGNAVTPPVMEWIVGQCVKSL